jgi:hypothetical protein
MSYKEGNAVIVNNEGKNEVGVVIKKFITNKNTFYDVLLESRSCISCINTARSNRIFIDRTLTKNLIDSGEIQCTIPYVYMLENDGLPYTR